MPIHLDLGSGPAPELARDRRDIRTTNGNNSNNNNIAAMGNFMDNSPNVMNMANMSRQSMSPSPQQMNGGGGVGNGNGGSSNGGVGPGAALGNNNMMNGLPMNAGHQMDLNNLYDMVVEFSDILKNNREMTRGIVASAEEIMVRTTFKACLHGWVLILHLQIASLYS